MKNKSNWLNDFSSAYQGKIIEVLSKNVPNGKPREVARRSPGVRVIAITKENEFVFSSEHREYLEKEIDIRLPGGKVVDTLVEYHALIEKGLLKNGILRAAKKELLEETGITGKNWRPFKVSTSGGTIDWDLHYFIAKDLSFGEAKPEIDEKIEVKRYSLKEAIGIALSPTIMSEDRSRLALLDYLLQEHPVEVSEYIIEDNTNDS